MTTNIPLVLTTSYDPMYPITGKHKVVLTPVEEEAFGVMMFESLAVSGHLGDLVVAHEAWKWLQLRFPRLRQFDGAEKSLG